MGHNETGRHFRIWARVGTLAILISAALLLFRNNGELSAAPDTGGRFSETEWESFRQYGEDVLAETLVAYNNGDYENFIKNFSQKRRTITRRAFESIWEVDYKERYGDFVSREFFGEKSNTVKNYPLLTYKAVFTENNEIGVRCVFTRDDDGEYRIFYLRFDPYADLFY